MTYGTTILWGLIVKRFCWSKHFYGCLNGQLRIIMKCYVVAKLVSFCGTFFHMNGFRILLRRRELKKTLSNAGRRQR